MQDFQDGERYKGEERNGEDSEEITLSVRSWLKTNVDSSKSCFADGRQGFGARIGQRKADDEKFDISTIQFHYTACPFVFHITRAKPSSPGCHDVK
jgi:hypothetical protein